MEGTSTLPVLSPGGHSLSYSYGRSMGVGSYRSRGAAMRTARGTGRVVPVVKDESDPLHGVRKKMPYEELVKELENNPEAEIRRYFISSDISQFDSYVYDFKICPAVIITISE